jgi:Fic family protein
MVSVISDYFYDLNVFMAHHSTAIEGNPLTVGDAKSILIDRIMPSACAGKSAKIYEEIENYRDFLEYLLDCLENNTSLSQDVIKNFHRCICKDVVEHRAGEYKKVPNIILGASFNTVQPYAVPTALENWITDCKAQFEHANSIRENLEAICRQHLKFEMIHPFPDGNGRVGRALMVFQCLKLGYPPCVIRVEDRGEYIDALNNQDIKKLTGYCFDLCCSAAQRIINGGFIAGNGVSGCFTLNLDGFVKKAN